MLKYRDMKFIIIPVYIFFALSRPYEWFPSFNTGTIDWTTEIAID